MDNKEVVAAIHQLELTLTDRIHTQTTLMEVMNERLDNLRIAVDRHREILFGHDDGNTMGLVADLNQLKNVEKERKWTVRTLAGLVMGACLKFWYDVAM